jgi:hypothetical protein
MMPAVTHSTVNSFFLGIVFLKSYSAIKRPVLDSSLRIAFPNRLLPEQNNVSPKT